MSIYKHSHTYSAHSDVLIRVYRHIFVIMNVRSEKGPSDYVLNVQNIQYKLSVEEFGMYSTVLCK